jgi:hypothetical protein
MIGLMKHYEREPKYKNYVISQELDEKKHGDFSFFIFYREKVEKMMLRLLPFD